jgi:glycosyltransferase involved in cell wall biosynthesis
MNVLIVHTDGKIPVFAYGGTQRDIWAEGKELVNMGHQVTYLVAKGSRCPFANIVFYNPSKTLVEQIPENTDLMHYHGPLYKEPGNIPYLSTIHGNRRRGEVFVPNTVFVSRDHARRHGSDQYVYNGLNLDELGKVNLNHPRKHLLFLAKASRSVKNLKGSLKIARMAGKKLAVIGGKKLSLNRNVKYHGLVGGQAKNTVIQDSEALLFPVLWHEPLGLAILESLYFGCPVFGTPYGSLPELIQPAFGHLSKSYSELAEAVQHAGSYDRKQCHEFIADNFSARKMTLDYLNLFEKILNGKTIQEKNPRTLVGPRENIDPMVP